MLYKRYTLSEILICKQVVGTRWNASQRQFQFYFEHMFSVLENLQNKVFFTEMFIKIHYFIEIRIVK